MISVVGFLIDLEEGMMRAAKTVVALASVILIATASIGWADESNAARLARERAETDGVDLSFPPGVEPATPGKRTLVWLK